MPDKNTPEPGIDSNDKPADPSKPDAAATSAAPTTTALTVDEARKAILDLLPSPTKTETISLTDAVGRVAAKDIHAVHDIPPFRNSAMDGYAIRHFDVQKNKTFKIIATSLAGHPYTENLSTGEAVKITTGAATPANADAIVIKELAKVDGNNFTTDAEISKNRYIRNPGDDIQRGQLLIAAKKELNAADTGLIAAQGLDTVCVFSKPSVCVFSTGDELCGPLDSLNDGQIFDSNRTAIRSLLTKSGIDSTDLGICEDNPKDIERTMKTAAKYDVAISSGGASVGEADYVKSVLEKNGKLSFWKVAMKPGKPLITGVLNSGTLYFGLPGNPVSSMVTSLQFVIPALRALSGCQYKAPLTLSAICQNQLKKEAGRFEFQRGKVECAANGQLQVSTTGLQDSHVLSSMSKANCFICLDQAATGAEPGEIVKVVLFESYPGL